MTSVTRHVQHHFYVFHGTVACTDYWLCYWHYTTWGVALSQGVVYNRKRRGS